MVLILCCRGNGASKDVVYEGQPKVDLGEKAFWDGKYQEAYSLLSPFVGEVPLAQALVGMLYEHGIEVEMDEEKAFDLYSQSAAGGHTLGKMLLCLYHFYETSVKDTAKMGPRKYMSLGAEARSAPDFQHWGDRSITGWRLKHPPLNCYFRSGFDRYMGHIFLKNAADGGIRKAQVLFGIHLFLGVNVEKDNQKAKKYLRLAADSGFTDAIELIKSLELDTNQR